MKLMIDARTLGSKPSGIGMYAYDFIKELALDERFELILLSDVATSSEIRSLSNAGITIVTYGQPVLQSISVFKYFRFVQDSLDFYQPDLFWEPNNLIPVKLRRFEGKIMVTIHDVFPLTLPEYHGGIYPIYFRYGMKKTLKQTNCLTFNSNETKQEVIRLFPDVKQIPNLVSYIIINKPNLADAPATPDVLFDKVKIDGEDFFLYVGNLEVRKGTDLLIKAFLRYKELGGTKKLYLGGKIREESIQKLYEEARKKTSDLVSLGYVDADQKNALYRYCYCFCFPSKAEGFGIPLIEAMHFNKPIIASNLSIFNEIIGDSINYFDLAGSESDQIESLANAMLASSRADYAAYAEVINRYLPEQLGKQFCDFVYEEGCR